MSHNSNKQRRRSIRLKDYDYSQAGRYFVTICTQNCECIFGKVVNGNMRLNKFGRVVETEWRKTPAIRNTVKLDAFIVMPNHFHGIVIIVDDVPVGATRRVAPTVSPILKSNTLGAIIGQIKSIVTKKIHRMGLGHFRWQRNYWEHVIRNEDKLFKIRQYIQNNPLKWHLDRENPERIGIDKLEDEIFRSKIAHKVNK
ncbi:MAG: transposase [candidate division Zixibacteria bacterium]|nr:transposase [candidate division Zixibacteria bacterium]